MRKTITLTEQQDACITAQVEGRERDHQRENLRRALVEGERSGKPEPFDFAAFKRRKAGQHD